MTRLLVLAPHVVGDAMKPLQTRRGPAPQRNDKVLVAGSLGSEARLRHAVAI